MDIQQILVINIMVISAIALVGAALQGAWRSTILWMAVNALVLAAGAAMLQWAPGRAGIVVVVLFVPLVMAPAILSRVTQTRVYQRRMKEAAVLARFAYWLHPTRQSRLNVRMIEAQSADLLADQVAALGRLAQQSPMGERGIVQATLLHLQGKWDALLALLDQQPGLARALSGLKVRALGEGGHLDQMTRAYDDAKSGLNGAELSETQLFLLAFSGRPADTARLLDGPLSGLDGDTRSYWIAVAQRAAGEAPQSWQPVLERISLAAHSPGVRQAASLVLAKPGITRPAQLDELSVVIVDDCSARIQRTALPDARPARMTPVTWLMLAGIAAGFALSVASGGSENLRVLIKVGAMSPAHVLELGEWWRLATATFLHFGPVHAGLNGLMLWVLGRACEHSFGSLRMALIYGLGGIGSSGFVLWLAAEGITDPAVLVGASGAIMALFGALAGRNVVTWLRYRDVLDGRNLIMLMVIVLVQMAVDLAMPQVSLAAHASGFVIGLAVGGLLSLGLTPRRAAVRI